MDHQNITGRKTELSKSASKLKKILLREQCRLRCYVFVFTSSWRLLIRNCAKRERGSNRRRDFVSFDLATVRFDWPRMHGYTQRLGSSTRFRSILGVEEGPEDKHRLDHPFSAIGSVVFAPVATPTARRDTLHCRISYSNIADTRQYMILSYFSVLPLSETRDNAN